MKKQGQAAFTLVELMVVIAIITLLVALIMPSFQGALAAQRNVRCQGNLEKIGQAYYTKQAADALAGAMRSDFAIGMWTACLSSYVSNSLEVFICPEDIDNLSMGESAMEKLRRISVEVYRGPANDQASWYWNVPLDESYASQYVWRLSEEQFQQLSSAPNHGQGYNHAGYQPGPNPSVFYFTFEDTGPAGGGDMDYWDQILKIELGSEIVVTPITGQAGYNFSLSMNESGTRKLLIPDLKAANGQPYPIPGGYGQTSYGMNSQCADLFKGERKLLVIDYETQVAAGSTYAQRPDPWLEDAKRFPTKVVNGKTIPQFFRHFNKANMLMADGSVYSKAFDELTIYQNRTRQEYWDPARPSD